MTTSEATDKLWPAFVAAKKAVTTAPRSSRNDVDGFDYADLTAVRNAYHTAASANGLADLHRVSQDDAVVTVTVRVIHESGQWFESDELAVPIAEPKDARAIGEAITYGRKYASAAVWGVTTGGDVDAREGYGLITLTRPDLDIASIRSEADGKFGPETYADVLVGLSPAQQLVAIRNSQTFEQLDLTVKELKGGVIL